VSPWQWLWDLSRDVAFKRAEFLATQAASSPGSSSVLVTDIPGLEWGTPLNRVSVVGAADHCSQTSLLPVTPAANVLGMHAAHKHMTRSTGSNGQQAATYDLSAL
jgi:4'-phosphopantetheinyl transferase EntD